NCSGAQRASTRSRARRRPGRRTRRADSPTCRYGSASRRAAWSRTRSRISVRHSATTQEVPMIVTVFRSRLKPEGRDEYMALAPRMAELARTMPGYLSHKSFVADDGERVTIVEF